MTYKDLVNNVLRRLGKQKFPLCKLTPTVNL